MGANQSQGEFVSHDQGWAGKNNFQTNKECHISGNYRNQKMMDRQRKGKAKPDPPSRIRFTDTTHNSITVSWQAPYQVDGHSIIAYTVEMSNVSPGRDKQWKILTKSCQGSSYDARNLETGTSYIFRVRSENIYGVGKPSLPSEICTTSMFETLPADIRSIGVPQSFYKCPDESAPNTKRSYGFNVHIEGGVKSILNHSDIIIESSSYSSSTLTSEKSQKLPNITRSNIHRTSLPSNRKTTAPILLPGTGSNSMYRLRESRRSLRTDTCDTQFKCSTRDSGVSGLREYLTVYDSSSLDIREPVNSNEDCGKKYQDLRNVSLVHSTETCTHSIDGDSGKGSKSSLCDIGKVCDNHSVTNSTDSDEHIIDINETKHVSVVNNDNKNVLDNISENSDDIYKLKEEMRSRDIYNEKLNNQDQNKGDIPFSATNSQNDYYNSLDNPWERNLSINGVSEHILAASLSDDVKMALHARNLPEDQRFTTSDCCCSLTESTTEDATDFRTLRNVLQSNNMIVKNTRSLPDVVAVSMVNGDSRTVTMGKLTTIVDTDEDDDAVRITTL